MSALANAHTQALSSQVGGHAGVLTTDDGSLIIKPALPVELKFYQSLASDPNFEALRPFTPNFLGTLKLEGQVDQSKPSEEGIVLAALETPQKDMSTSIRRPVTIIEIHRDPGAFTVHCPRESVPPIFETQHPRCQTRDSIVLFRCFP